MNKEMIIDYIEILGSILIFITLIFVFYIIKKWIKLDSEWQKNI